MSSIQIKISKQHIVSMAWQSHNCCTKSTDLRCLTKTKVPRVAQKCSEFFYIVLAWSESPNQSFMFRSFCTVKWPKMTRIQIELKLDTNAKCETKRNIWGVFVLQKGSHNFDIGAWSKSFMFLRAVVKNQNSFEEDLFSLKRSFIYLVSILIKNLFKNLFSNIAKSIKDRGQSSDLYVIYFTNYPF